jgi:2-octaprenyl-6-methoxyphenol hydroxylase
VTDIAILGCGMTGMITALSFAAQNIPTKIIEYHKGEKFPPDVRTTTFTKLAKDFLEKVGIWEIVQEEAGFVNDIYIVDNKSPQMLHLSSKKNEPKGYVLRNMLIKEKLYKAVKNHPLIEIHRGISYDGLEEKDGKIIISNDLKFDVALVCDGRGGKIKDRFSAKFDKSYAQCAIVMECQHELGHENVAVEHFMPKGPFALLPMQDPYMSSVVWTEALELKNTFEKMPKDLLTQHLQEKMGEFLGKVTIVSDVQIFPLSARIANNYYQGNLLLVGDAAHAIHPLAGQGLNQGIKDIETLTEIFAKRINHGLEIDELAYMEYENARKLDNRAVFCLTDNINRIFSNEIFPLSVFRKLSLSIMNESSLLKRLVSSGSTVF